MSSSGDIVISYSDVDKEFAKYLADELQKLGLNVVWHDQDVPGQPSKGHLIAKSKVFVMILSVEGCENMTVLKNELALAYVSNKSIYPIGRKYYRKIAEHLDSGVKLMLAKINWTFFVKEEQFTESLQNLCQSINTELVQLTQTQPSIDVGYEEDVFEALNKQSDHAPVLDRKLSAFPERPDDVKTPNDDVCHHQSEVNSDFWVRHFGGQNEVTWIELKDRFLEDYQDRALDLVGTPKKVQWLVKLLHKDIFGSRKFIEKTHYLKFCGKNDQADCDHFFNRLKDYAIGNIALKEVLGMDSTVRLAAISNLAQFNTPAVITQLFDLTEDEDPNTRAVAGLALAKSGKRSRKIEDALITLLEDEDRVVRESACLSLAHIKCQRAVQDIVHLWRNDAIKHVREAAEIALSRIGGDEADEAIKVTKILSSEMDNLRMTKK